MRLTTRLWTSLLKFGESAKWNEMAELRRSVERSCLVKTDFINEEEEKSLLAEVEPHMKRLRYEKSHWDDAIHLYREREQRKWSVENEKIIQRIRCESFGPGSEHLTHVHILDLHKDGVIKPHIDSVRYCGDVITGVSLLSDAVMRLRHKDDSKELVVDLLLPRRSLYRLGELGRYEFTHEILGDDESTWEGTKVPRERRISIICRDEPKRQNAQGDVQLRLQPIAEADT